jgi:hypothetical protein
MPSPSPTTADLTFLVRRPGRFHGESRVVVTAAGGRARGLWSAGRPGLGLRPWADLEEADAATLPAIAAALGPGASIMVRYGDDATERALRARVPPAATAVGLALLRAGCRWLKDWSFAEGGREGPTKLQGELPLDASRARHAEEALRIDLEAFLAGDGGTLADRRRAREALRIITPPAERRLGHGRGP